MDDLLKIKIGIERNIEDLGNEATTLRERLTVLSSEKLDIQQSRVSKHTELYKLKLSLVDLQEQLDGYSEYIKLMTEKQQSVERAIEDVVKLNHYEEEVKKKLVLCEKMMTFYNEDSLQIDLMKKTNEVREKRVKYTELDKEYRTMLQLIQEEKKKRELALQAELERKRQEEEAAREEERLRALAQSRQEILQQRATSMCDPQLMSPLQVQPGNQKPFLLPEAPISFRIPEKPQQSNDPVLQSADPKNSAPSVNINRDEYSDRATFSQMLRW